MWYASLPELLLFFFCMLFMLGWNVWLQRQSRWALAFSFACFLLALLSKEAGVALVPVAAAMAWQRRANLWPIAPLALMAALYSAAIFMAGSSHLHLNDGTFTFRTPFPIIWARSMWRIFWVWGLLSIVAIILWNRRAGHRLLRPAFWMAVTLAPFCFLAYMPFVPSRHTYLASAGIGFFIAAGLGAVRKRFPARRWAMPVLLAILVAQQTGYLWTKKRGQFLRRAAATEELVALAARVDTPIYITCFPYSHLVAEKALAIRLTASSARLVWNAPPPPGAVQFCAADP